MNPRIGRLVLVALLASACSRSPRISDTGYVGTWQRGEGMAASTIAIVHDGERYRFRWDVDSIDGRWYVNCDWDGRCEEFVEGVKTSDYRFRAWVDPESDLLRVECKGKVTKPEELDIFYVDELVVRGKGRRLWAYTIRDGDREYRPRVGPRRTYRKVSDEVEDPPAQVRSAEG